MRKNSRAVGGLVVGAFVVLAGLTLFAGTAAAQTDEPSYTVAVAPASVVEGDDGETKVEVTVTRSPMPALGANEMEDVAFVREGSSTAWGAHGAVEIPAGEDADYTHTAPNPTQFSAGTLKVTFEFAIIGDDEAEPDEVVRFTINVGTGGSAVAIQTNVSSFTIENDDDPPVRNLKLTGADGSLKESATGAAREQTLTVSTDAPFTRPLTINLEFGGDATKGEDYTVDKEVLTLPAGTLQVKAKLTIVDDAIYDGPVPETVRISAFVGSDQIGGTGTIELIDDNDQNPEDFMVAVAPAMIKEGEVSTVTVTTTTAPTADQTFMLMTAGTATENADYTIASELKVLKGQTKGSVQLQAVMDSLAGEPDETVMVTVTSGGVTVGTTQTITIMGDAATPTPTPTPALPLFGAFALGAGLLTAGRARLRRRAQRQLLTR